MADMATQPSTWTSDDPAMIAAEDSKEGWGTLVASDKTFSNVDLEGASYTVGRTNCDIIHDDKTISGLHCKIWRVDDVVWIQDCSTNGTFLDGAKLGKNNKTVLKNGQKIVLIPKSSKRAEVAYTIYIFAEQNKSSEDALSQRYHIRQTLGTGAFATVKLCVDKNTGMKYAMKIIEKKKFYKQQGTARADALKDEVNILQQLNHPCIIGITDSIETEENLYLVLELVTGGDLFDAIVAQSFYPEDRARYIFKQMVDAVAYLHGKGIVHRDLKPENILLKFSDKDDIAISDFGLSRIVGEGSFMKTLCGTPQYLAPEVLTESKAPHGGYTHAVDVWSMGVILYVMLSGATPFDDTLPTPIFDQIKKGIVAFPHHTWSKISPSATDLVKKLLVVNPAERMTIAGISSHPWMKGHRTVDVAKRKAPDAGHDTGSDEPDMSKPKAAQSAMF